MHTNSSSKDYLLFFCTVITFLTIGIHLSETSATAAVTYQDNQDYFNALKAAPKGLNWENDAFVKADFSNAIAYRKGKPFYTGPKPLGTPQSSLINNAEVVKSTNPNNPETSIIKMTNGKWQTGAVWSNKSVQNYFSIDHEQKASMWLYFGKNGSLLPGDGMAFIIQNDPNGTNAIALSANGIPANGQSLGVWGPDWNYNNKDSSKLANAAIQNSWALEFDTFVNYQTSNDQILTANGVAFDSDNMFESSASQHIAGNYPALASTYKSANSHLNYFVLDHGDNVKISSYNGSMNLVDSKWHHVTITWEPLDSEGKEGTLTYAYNDKNATTGKPQTAGLVTTSFKINTDNFFKSDGATTPDKSNKNLYWGFTGSTGDNSENNLLIFESLPSFVDAEATANIYDDTQGGKQINNNDSVDPNDDIRYEYFLNYKGWAKKWSNIVANMEVPNHVTFTGGTISYPGLAGDRPQPLPESALKPKPDSNGTPKLQYKLLNTLDSNQRYAKIELHGHTDSIATKKLTVPSAHASFEGDNLITDANTNSYYINARGLILTSSSKNPIELDKKEDLDVPGQVTYATPNYYPDYSSMVVYQTLNGKTTPIYNAIDSTGKFNLHISSSDLLDKGDNTLNFYVISPNENLKSNSITRRITVGGTLAFGYIQDFVNFRPTNGSYRDQVIHRSDNWQIDVIDSRKIGSSWTVQASASDLLGPDKTKLKGNLFYRDINGKDQDLDKLINVASHTKNTDTSEPKNITETWTANNGILLNMKKGNQAGQYQGTIQWILLDSIQNS